MAKTRPSESQMNTSTLPSRRCIPPRLCPLLDVRAAREQINMGGVTYPTLPLQEALPRPPAGYGHPSAVCSPTASFAGSLPPQPHSSYFSGLTGPQHPFYNRVRHEGSSCLPNLYSLRCANKRKKKKKMFISFCPMCVFLI